jgi:hypothetical protein
MYNRWYRHETGLEVWILIIPIRTVLIKRRMSIKYMIKSLPDCLLNVIEYKLLIRGRNHLRYVGHAC